MSIDVIYIYIYMSICWIHSHVALEVGPQEMAQRLQDLDAERPDATALGRSERLAATAALSGTAGTEEAAGDAEENDWMLKAQLIGGVYGKYLLTIGGVPP